MTGGSGASNRDDAGRHVLANIEQVATLALAETDIRVARAALSDIRRLAAGTVADCARCDELEDDLITALKVRNEALRQAACEVIVGPDGQDDLDRSRLVAKWVEEAYEELGIAQGEPMVPVVQPKPSLTAWADEHPSPAARDNQAAADG